MVAHKRDTELFCFSVRFCIELASSSFFGGSCEGIKKWDQYYWNIEHNIRFQLLYGFDKKQLEREFIKNVMNLPYCQMAFQFYVLRLRKTAWCSREKVEWVKFLVSAAVGWRVEWVLDFLAINVMITKLLFFAHPKSDWKARWNTEIGMNDVHQSHRGVSVSEVAFKLE